MMQNMPQEITGPEVHVYSVGADKSRASYRKRNGAGVTMSLEERRSWNAAHADGLTAAGLRGGLSAVRKLHTARVEHLATVTGAGQVVANREGGPVSGPFLASLMADAAHAAERLEILATVDGKRTTPRKPAARKLAAVPEVVAPVEIVAEETTAPETVPAPMPAMTRAARKATRREIAATMRAAGVKPEGDAWREACRAAGLPVSDESMVSA